MIVVFDTNIWKSSLFLKAGAAAAVRFYLKQKGAKVGMPEVIRLEVERHLRAELRALKDGISCDYQRLLGMVGSLNEVTLPDDAHLENVAANFISSLDFDLIETSFTFEAARSSLMRTIDKVPPSHKSQQFKDGVIWADCLALAQTDHVTLVTNDKAFYEGDDSKNGLSSRLQTETANLPFDIKLVDSLSALMMDIRQPVTVNDALLVSAVNAQLEAGISGMLDLQGFTRAGDPVVSKTFYATEKPSTLFIEFRLKFPCEDASQAGRVDAVLTVTGDGQYRAAEQKFLGLSPTDLCITYRTADGVEELMRATYGRFEGVVLGTRTVRHRVREPLKDSA
jgi:predicted nucleic acid-binding protein